MSGGSIMQRCRHIVSESGPHRGLRGAALGRAALLTCCSLMQAVWACPSLAQSFSLGVRLDVYIGQSVRAVAAGDLNGDGKPDLVVTNQGGNTVYVLLGNGSGGFSVGSPIVVANTPVSVAIGDLNSDGKADLVV